MRYFKTYIRGFDEEIEGGIPQGHVVLLAGPPGTMKSSLAYSILYNNALHDGVSGVFVTMEQERESLEFQVGKMGMEPQKVGEKVRIQDLSRIRRGVEELRGAARFGSPAEKPWLDVLKRHLEDVKATEDFSLLVLDSLPVLEIISGLRERRVGLFHFFGWLKSLKVTSFVISEVSPDHQAVRDEDFLADGILSLTMDRVGELDVYRRIRCVKMRGVNHNPGIFTIEFRDGAFHVTRVI
ncbi:MAG TPA: ATPase domain-containing protein [Thermoplasmata archaeon]